MNIAIFGAKNEAIYINQQITGLYPHLHTTKCFIDNNPELAGEIIDNVQVVSFNNFLEHYNDNIDAVIIAVRNLNSVLEIAMQLREKDIKKIGCVLLSTYDYDMPFIIDEAGNSRQILWLTEKGKPIMPHLEANIIDECNLNCKGCSHFSNLFCEESRYDLKSFEQDLIQISHNCYVINLYLLGGEPFLCNNLNKYVELSRKIFPQSDITIVTNGLLVFKQPDEVYECIRENDVHLQISPYKPAMKIKDKIAEFLLSKNLRFRFGRTAEASEILEFSKILSKTYDSDSEKSMAVCTSRFCRFLRNGKLYKCPVEGMLYKFLEVYNIDNNIKTGIDIYNISNWGKALAELRTPVDACKYCTETPEFIDWEVSNKPDMRDWIVD